MNHFLRTVSQSVSASGYSITVSWYHTRFFLIWNINKRKSRSKENDSKVSFIYFNMTGYLKNNLFIFSKQQFDSPFWIPFVRFARMYVLLQTELYCTVLYCTALYVTGSSQYLLHASETIFTVCHPVCNQVRTVHRTTYVAFTVRSPYGIRS